jgi:hypothetical protein
MIFAACFALINLMEDCAILINVIQERKKIELEKILN